jgi:hypothetical protein
MPDLLLTGQILRLFRIAIKAAVSVCWIQSTSSACLLKVRSGSWGLLHPFNNSRGTRGSAAAVLDACCILITTPYGSADTMNRLIQAGLELQFYPAQFAELAAESVSCEAAWFNTVLLL